jgi:hypothetical protein
MSWLLLSVPTALQLLAVYAILGLAYFFAPGTPG